MKPKKKQKKMFEKKEAKVTVKQGREEEKQVNEGFLATKPLLSTTSFSYSYMKTERKVGKREKIKKQTHLR